ncbi:TIR domain-containing protein [Psychrobacter sp. DM8]|uniref:TIR domain-containing protein n=1 Tax=Psychrobacter sp. DM8 TaxID=3440636 RepID=UPI003F50C05E
MTVKLFISYAHKDENFKENLEEHLSSLKRQGVIEAWNDRDITAGQKWEDEIDNNISNADLILLLISASFNNSDYCSSKEVQQAIQQHNQGDSVVIPVILRPCDWHDLPFSKFQGLPKDGMPIAKWGDEDEAWLNVIEGLKKAIKDFNSKKKAIKVLESVKETALNKSTITWLEDTEVQLNHRKGDIVRLSDIYIPPDLEEYESKSANFINNADASKFIDSDKNLVIFGDSQMGKTSLLKFYYKKLFYAKKVIYIDLSLDVNAISDYKKTLQRAIEQQYNNLMFDDLKGQRNLILIDNFDKTKLNKRSATNFINFIEDLGLRIIITSNEEYGCIIDEYSIFDSFKKLKIMGLGNKKRDDLITKWVSLGQETTISESNLYQQVDYITDNINKVLKKNVVPSRPIYIIMVLQMFEAQTKMDIELTSYGHCYQQLIYNSLESIKIKPKDYGLYLNILTELAWWAFTKSKSIAFTETDNFFSKYNSDYIADFNRVEVLDKLVKCGILSKDVNGYNFRYPYLFYFFVAKKIADNCNDSEEYENYIDELIKKLHREDYANILIFVTHHSSSKIVLKKIEGCLNSQYSGLKQATFGKENLSFINNFITSIPKLVIEQREIQSERDKHNKNLDRLDALEDNTEMDVNDEILSDINRVFKSIEISGQIIKSRHYNLKKNELSDLAVFSIDAGLRFASYFLDISESAKESVINLIAENISNDPESSNEVIRKYAEKSYLFLTYSVLSMVIQKISNSIGAKEVNEIYEQISKEKGTPAYNLIKLSIDLHFGKKIDINFIKDMRSSFKDNVVCLRLMKEFLIHHIYMFPVEYQVKQQLSDILDIPIDKQSRLEQVSKNKSALNFQEFKRVE